MPVAGQDLRGIVPPGVRSGLPTTFRRANLRLQFLIVETTPDYLFVPAKLRQFVRADKKGLNQQARRVRFGSLGLGLKLYSNFELGHRPTRY